MLTSLMLIRLAHLCPTAVLQHVDRLVEPLRTTCAVKVSFLLRTLVCVGWHAITASMLVCWMACRHCFYVGVLDGMPSLLQCWRVLVGMPSLLLCRCVLRWRVFTAYNVCWCVGWHAITASMLMCV